MKGCIKLNVRLTDQCQGCEMLKQSYKPEEYGMYYCKLGNNCENNREKQIGYVLNETKPEWCPIKPCVEEE